MQQIKITLHAHTAEGLECAQQSLQRLCLDDLLYGGPGVPGFSFGHRVSDHAARDFAHHAFATVPTCAGSPIPDYLEWAAA